MYSIAVIQFAKHVDPIMCVIALTKTKHQRITNNAEVKGSITI